MTMNRRRQRRRAAPARRALPRLASKRPKPRQARAARLRSPRRLLPPRRRCRFAAFTEGGVTKLPKASKCIAASKPFFSLLHLPQKNRALTKSRCADAANAAADRNDSLAPPEVWVASDGSIISCTEKVKVLEDNWNEVRELLQNALDDAVLMGCTQAQFKHEYTRLINALQSEYKEKSSL